MKKALIIILLLIVCICTYITFHAYQYYAPPQLRQPYKIPNHNNHDDTLRIAYIGDSWAYLHNCHNCKITQIIEDSIHHPASVHSFGICGLTSKEIYNALFDDSNFKRFMQNGGYDYCFVSAGINDTYKKMSTTYYKKSMEGIIDFLLANHIHPIILEVPDYDIFKAYENQKIDRKVLRHISMFINDTGVDCKQLYRDTLDSLLTHKEYHDKVHIIRHKFWNKDHLNTLHQLYVSDGMHLNNRGYAILDSMIANAIITNFHYNYETK